MYCPPNPSINHKNLNHLIFLLISGKPDFFRNSMKFRNRQKGHSVTTLALNECLKSGIYNYQKWLEDQ